MWKKPPCPNQLDSFNCFDTVPACNGQTDEQTHYVAAVDYYYCCFGNYFISGMIALYFDPAPLLANSGAPPHCPSPKAENVAMPLLACCYTTL